MAKWQKTSIPDHRHGWFGMFCSPGNLDQCKEKLKHYVDSFTVMDGGYVLVRAIPTTRKDFLRTLAKNCKWDSPEQFFTRVLIWTGGSKNEGKGMDRQV